MNTDEYITFADAMELLGVDRQKLRRLIRSWKLPTYENALDRRQVMLQRAQILAIKTNPIQQKQPRKQVTTGKIGA